MGSYKEIWQEGYDQCIWGTEDNNGCPYGGWQADFWHQGWADAFDEGLFNSEPDDEYEYSTGN